MNTQFYHLVPKLLVLLLLVSVAYSSRKNIYQSEISSNPGVIKVQHHTGNTSLKVNFHNINRQYPSVEILRKFQGGHSRRKKPKHVVSSTTKSSVVNTLQKNQTVLLRQNNSLYYDNITSTLDPTQHVLYSTSAPTDLINLSTFESPIEHGTLHSSENLPIGTVSARNSSLTLITNKNQKLEEFISINVNKNSRIQKLYNDLLLCNAKNTDLELRLLDYNNRLLREVMNCEAINNNLKADITNCEDRILMENNTNDCPDDDIKSDLAACVANTEGLEWERDNYIAKYIQMKYQCDAAKPQADSLLQTKSISTSTIYPVQSSIRIETDIRDIEWSLSSCKQHLKRLETDLLTCNQRHQ